MAHVTEIAPDLYRLCIYVPEFDMQFNHFLVKDDEPLLYHTGFRRMFPELSEAVARVMPISSIRWIGFSHFESDECGALNQWLEVAPAAQPVCGLVGALVSVNDFSARPARAMNDGEVLTTGRRRFRFCGTPHLPHGWDAGVLLEQTGGTLLCSDLFHQFGDVEPLTTADDIVGRSREALLRVQSGPLAGYVPYTQHTGRLLDGLADLAPRTLAAMHGSSFTGNCARALRELAEVMKEVLGQPGAVSAAQR